MLVPAAVLFAFGVVIFFCLIPSPDQIGKSNKKRLHVQHSCPMSIIKYYRKLPLISPRLIQVCKGFWVGL